MRRPFETTSNLDVQADCIPTPAPRSSGGETADAVAAEKSLTSGLRIPRQDAAASNRATVIARRRCGMNRRKNPSRNIHPANPLIGTPYISVAARPTPNAIA